MEAACKVGAGLRTPIFFLFIQFFFFLPFFLVKNASQPRRGTSTARARSRSANPEEVVLRALRHHAS